MHNCYFKKGKTVAEQYYSVPKIVFEEDKSADLHCKNPLLAADGVIKMKICLRIATHPACFPKSAPSNYFLYPNLQKWLGLKRFLSKKEDIAETSTYFTGGLHNLLFERKFARYTIFTMLRNKSLREAVYGAPALRKLFMRLLLRFEIKLEWFKDLPDRHSHNNGN